jgi:hypothetical protein
MIKDVLEQHKDLILLQDPFKLQHNLLAVQAQQILDARLIAIQEAEILAAHSQQLRDLFKQHKDQFKQHKELLLLHNLYVVQAQQILDAHLIVIQEAEILVALNKQLRDQFKQHKDLTQLLKDLSQRKHLRICLLKHQGHRFKRHVHLHRLQEDLSLQLLDLPAHQHLQIQGTFIILFNIKSKLINVFYFILDVLPIVLLIPMIKDVQEQLLNHMSPNLFVSQVQVIYVVHLIAIQEAEILVVHNLHHRDLFKQHKDQFKQHKELLLLHNLSVVQAQQILDARLIVILEAEILVALNQQPKDPFKQLKDLIQLLKGQQLNRLRIYHPRHQDHKFKQHVLLHSLQQDLFASQGLMIQGLLYFLKISKII